MKTRSVQTILAATVLAVTAFLSRAEEEPKPPIAITNPAPPSVSVPATNASVTPAPPPEPQEVQIIQVPKLTLPPLLDQVVKLAESGTDEKIIRAYVEKAAPAYRITGNDIVQLRDLGISQDVILSLIEHSSSVGAAGVAEPAVASATPAPATAPLNPAPPADAAEFQEALSPYGSWMDVPGYGRCWQPTVVVVNPGWRPYCDNGDWLWSDYGWYWHSYYSWGWAPFHYGRWFAHADRGWLWCPDRVWGPSWVSWRNSATHCGWAPLPPGAHFSVGMGWTFHGARVGVDFGFGLGAAHFTFVAHDRFSDRHVGRHTLRGTEASTAYRGTRVVNNYTAGANHRVINHGIGRETVAAAAHTPVREVSVRDLPRGNSITSPDRVSRVGNAHVIYRPVVPSSVPRTTTVRNATTVPVRPATTVNSLAPSSRALVGGGTARPQTVRNYSTFAPNPSQVVMPRQVWNTAAARPVQAGRSQYQVYSRPSTPVSSAGRSSVASASAPRFTAPRISAPSTVGRMSSPSVSPSFRSGAGGSRSAMPVPSRGTRR